MLGILWIDLGIFFKGVYNGTRERIYLINTNIGLSGMED